MTSNQSYEILMSSEIRTINTKIDPLNVKLESLCSHVSIISVKFFSYHSHTSKLIT